MATRTRPGWRPTGRAPLLSSATIAQMRWWSSRQWRVATVGFVAAFVLIGEIGETLPPASVGRMYPVLWWNWVTLAACSVLFGLIAATFVGPVGRRVLGGAGSGSAGVVAAVAMACPVCSPLALPLLGTGGVLAFLLPDRGWIALAAVAVLSLSLLLRLRATGGCPVPVENSVS